MGWQTIEARNSRYVRTRRYTYDAKARLTSAWRRPCGSADFEFVFSNVYDHLDRRVQKITPEATHTYFYDGWMLIKEVVANTNGATNVIEYHWGKDLSGTIGGAGGVGGLLYVKINGAIYVPFYDNNGNVRATMGSDPIVAETP